MFSLDSYLCTHLPCVYSTLCFHDVRPQNNYYYNSCEIAKKLYLLNYMKNVVLCFILEFQGSRQCVSFICVIGGNGVAKLVALQRKGYINILSGAYCSSWMHTCQQLHSLIIYGEQDLHHLYTNFFLLLTMLSFAWSTTYSHFTFSISLFVFLLEGPCFSS